MPKHISVSGSAVEVEDDLDRHLSVFLATLVRVGYAEKTQRVKTRLIRPFIQWIRQSERLIADIDESSIEAFLACPERRRYKHCTALQQFVEHLRLMAAAPPSHCEPSPADTRRRRRWFAGISNTYVTGRACRRTRSLPMRRLPVHLPSRNGRRNTRLASIR